jgi:predicted nucleotidyltransferase
VGRLLLWRRRIVAAFLSGSAARGEADEHSDLDLYVVVPDDDDDEVVEDRERLIAQLGDALFLEDFGHDDLVFAISTAPTSSRTSS